MLPEVKNSSRQIRRQRPEPVRRRDRDFRHRRRPAGRHHRPGLLHARHDQVDLRHRLFCPPQHRHHTGRLEEQAPHHHRLSARRKVTYALEGSIFVAGSAVQWCAMASASSSRRPRPAPRRQIRIHRNRLSGAGLRRPRRTYSNPRVRGALFGLTRNTGPAELAHAALESVCYRTSDSAKRCAPTCRKRKPPTCSASTAA